MMGNKFNSIEWFAYGNDESKTVCARIENKWFIPDRHNPIRLLPLSSILVDDMESMYQEKLRQETRERIFHRDGWIK